MKKTVATVIVSAAAFTAAGGAGAAPEADAAAPIEVIEVSTETASLADELMAAMLGLGPDAGPVALQAALNSVIVAFGDDETTIAAALAVILDGDLTDAQRDAVIRLFAVYSPDDVDAPSGGASMHDGDDDSPAARLAGGAARAKTESPPPTTANGGGSDYDS